MGLAGWMTWKKKSGFKRKEKRRKGKKKKGKGFRYGGGGGGGASGGLLVRCSGGDGDPVTFHQERMGENERMREEEKEKWRRRMAFWRPEPHLPPHHIPVSSPPPPSSSPVSSVHIEPVQRERRATTRRGSSQHRKKSQFLSTTHADIHWTTTSWTRSFPRSQKVEIISTMLGRTRLTSAPDFFFLVVSPEAGGAAVRASMDERTCGGNSP